MTQHITGIPFRDKHHRKQTIGLIYQDEQILIVDKPAGLTVIPDRWNPEADTLQTLCEGYLNNRLLVVHRLDRDTSGIVLFARDAEAHRFLNECFQSRDVQKTYLAIVDGVPRESEGEIDAPIERHPGGKKMWVARKGKAALTRYQLVEKYGTFSLLKVFPESGRTHQIRVHLASIGLPLLVDPLYGTRDRFDLSEVKSRYRKKDPFAENPAIIERLTLHAAALQFPHPNSRETREFSAPLPRDFRATLKQLEKWGRDF